MEVEVQVEEVMLTLVRQMDASVRDLNAKLTEHIVLEASMTSKLVNELLVRSFPDGDPDGHRRHHEAVIKAAEARAEFWSKMRYDLVKWGLLAFLGWGIAQVGIMVWKVLLAGPK